jgi:hypothetical protein
MSCSSDVRMGVIKSSFNASDLTYSVVLLFVPCLLDHKVMLSLGFQF